MSEPRPGCLVLVTGPSGAGKDTLIAGARARLDGDPRVVFARRCITRAADAGGEDHEALTPEAFEARRAAGRFLAAWEAHGLRYGLPATLLEALGAGRHVVANVSRAAVGEIARVHPRVRVVEVGAPPEVVASRLAGRGREAADLQAMRLERRVPPYPAGIEVVRIDNDGTPEAGAERLLAAILDS